MNVEGEKQMEVIRIRTDQAEPGMMVASDIYTTGDQLIITKGTVLNDRLIPVSDSIIFMDY